MSVDGEPDVESTDHPDADQGDDAASSWQAFFDGVVRNDPRVASLIAYDGVEIEAVLAVAHEIADSSPLDVPARFAELEAARRDRDVSVGAVAADSLDTPIGFAVFAAALAGVAWLVILVLHWSGAAHGVSASIFGIVFGGLVALTIVLVVVGVSMDTRRTRSANVNPTRAAEKSALLADQLQAALGEEIRELVVVPTVERASVVRFLPPAQDQLRLAGALSMSTRAEARDRIETESYRRLAINLKRTGGATVGLAGSRGAGKSELLRTFCDPETYAPADDDVRTVAVAVSAPVSFEPESFARLLVRRLAESVPGYDAAAVARPVRWWSEWDTIAVVAIVALGLASSALLAGAGLFSRHDVGFALLVLAGLVLVVWGGLKGSWLRRSLRSRRLIIARDTGEDRARRLTAAVRDQMARRAVEVVQRMRYLESRSMSGEASASVKAVGLKVTHGRSLDQVPLTATDIVAEFESLVRDLRRAYPRVVIGIDELDKLGTGEDAEKFLNGIKMFFSVPHCSFVLTVSDNAFAQFARRGMPIRDVFDSSLDAVIWVKRMSFDEARRLTRARLQTVPSERMSDSQILLSHVLSGGLPRDFLRYARQIGELGTTTNARQLGDVLDELLNEEVRMRIDGVRAAVAGRDQAGPVGPLLGELEMLERSGLGTATDRHLNAFLDADAEFATLCRQHDGFASASGSDASASADGGSWFAEIRRQLYAFLYFADTVRLAFTTWTAFGDARGTISAFESLSNARQRLETDAATGWRAISSGRRQMALHAVEPTRAQAMGGAGESRPHREGEAVPASQG